MGNCHFKTDFDTENITGKLSIQIKITGETLIPSNQRPRIVTNKNNQTIISHQKHKNINSYKNDQNLAATSLFQFSIHMSWTFIY